MLTPRSHTYMGTNKGMLGKILAFVLGVAGLIAGSQAPNFTTHFMQNLVGRVDERRLDAERITERWEYYGVDRDQVAADCRARSEEKSNPQASCLEDEMIVRRFEKLLALQEELQAASKWERPILLGRALLDGSCSSDVPDALKEKTENRLDTLCTRYLAMNSLKEFELAVPVTMDGLAYGAGGGVGFWAIFRLLFGLIGMPFRSRYAY